MDIMDDRFKRLNTLTGELFEPGFKDENGRFFLRYLKKQGNDGYYLEEWKKDYKSFVKKIIPKKTIKDKIEALLSAQEISFSQGLTTVSDAGLNKEDILLIDSLQSKGILQIKVYAMISNNKESLDYFLKRGVLKTDHLNVRSVKVLSRY